MQNDVIYEMDGIIEMIALLAKNRGEKIHKRKNVADKSENLINVIVRINYLNKYERI